MKFYKKKEVSLEKTPILFRLERRHTLLEGGKHEETDDDSRPASRANSVGSYTRPDTPTDMKRAATLSKLCLTDDNRSNFSAASTVVITESELSSSWLYKSRKAKIDNEEENISTNSNGTTEDQDMQPVPLLDPALKPVPVPLKPRSEKVSSCCCYLLVAITICVASLGIMAAIGGIIYLEVFAAYKEVAEGQHAIQEQSLDVASNRNGESSSSEANFDNVELIMKKDKEISNENLEQNPFLDESHKEGTDPIVGGNSKGVFDPGEQSNRNATLDPVSLHQEVGEGLEQQSDKGWAKEFDNSDSIDSSFDDFKNIDKDESFSNIHVPLDNNMSVTNILLENQDEIEINGFSEKEQNFGLDPIQNHQTDSGFPVLEQDISENTLDIKEENLNSSNSDISLNENPETENIFGFEPHGRNLFDSDQDQMILNHPIVEAKPPIEFQNRVVGNQNQDPNQSLTIRDMDRKFSLSEILKHLRTLDANNRLPASRNKDVVTETVKISSNQDIGSERKEYLGKLRRKIYD